MGYYINTGNAGFQSSRNGEYVDDETQYIVIFCLSLKNKTKLS